MCIFEGINLLVIFNLLHFIKVISAALVIFHISGNLLPLKLVCILQGYVYLMLGTLVKQTKGSFRMH